MRNQRSKVLIPFLFVLLLGLYVLIKMYVLFGIIHIDLFKNFLIGLIFELISFVILTTLIIGNIVSKSIKLGYFIPLLMVTVIYAVLLDVLCIVFLSTMATPFFILCNLVLLFVYCLISIPMYAIGRR